MINSKTILSSSIAIAEALKDSAAVVAITGPDNIIPVRGFNVESPYVVFRRSGLVETAVKGTRGADTVTIELLCVCPEHEQSLELAEAVRDALDGTEITTDDGYTIRSCRLTAAQEYAEDDNFIQQLIFTVKI